MSDASFSADPEGLKRALDALLDGPGKFADAGLPSVLPEQGIGDAEAIGKLAPMIVAGARRLGADTAFAHMDPPTPWMTWATALWNAALNQNLLHPELSPVARRVEERVIQWLAPHFGMAGGHMTPGSTIANLTALWAARETKGVQRVVASRAAHLSIAKSANLLGLELLDVDTDDRGCIDPAGLPADLSSSALVLTAGTTSTGAIDKLALGGRAAWTHVDAAWAGPLRLSAIFAPRLDGLDAADSVAISAHKWLFQPKESGMALFRDVPAAHEAIRYGGEYLAVPNTGVLGSHGANAVPLLATLLAWGRSGLALRIETAMAIADALHAFLDAQSGVRLYGPNTSGVILWRVDDIAKLRSVYEQLPAGMASMTSAGGIDWIRHVAANPNADIDALKAAIENALPD